MNLPRPTELAHMILGNHLKPGDLAIDATAGNGHDTVFLASCVGNIGRVLAFDIQQKALDTTKHRLQESGVSGLVRLVLGSHATMADYTPSKSAAAIVFNLGYLPGSDHSITTVTAETLRALDCSTELLIEGGLITVVCYPGHDEGAIEASMVEEWFSKLANQNWRVTHFGHADTKNPSPFLLTALKPGSTGALG